jgi:hypothetical protein
LEETNAGQDERGGSDDEQHEGEDKSQGGAPHHMQDHPLSPSSKGLFHLLSVAAPESATAVTPI